MTGMSLNEAIEAFTNLTETLQDCIKFQDIEGAMTLARKRHDKLVDLLERSEIDQGDKMAFAKTALIHLKVNGCSLNRSAHQGRSNFIARKSAFARILLKQPELVQLLCLSKVKCIFNEPVQSNFIGHVQRTTTIYHLTRTQFYNLFVIP